MDKLLETNRTDFLLRLGLGLIFLANALTAWFSPNEFREIFSKSFLHLSSNSNSLINLIRINDSLLFIFFLFGVYRKVISLWAGIWLLAVIAVTGTNTPDFAEHLGILALIGYYFLKIRSSSPID